ncbi:MAG: ArsR family transcriptional regulator [Candidatus Hydrothermarchaeales archaeon]
MRLEQILDMLGNETRREILQLLSERPCYVTELSQELDIGHKAIIEHLEGMRRAGIIASQFKKVEKGRPRKYFAITQNLILEIKIGQDHFDIESFVPEIDEEILKSIPNLRNVTRRLEDISRLTGAQRIRELEIAHDELNAEHRNLSEAKKVVEYLLGEVRTQLRKPSEIAQLF